MRSLLRTVQRIARDISSGQHIEAYAIALVSFLLAALSLVQDILPMEIQMAALLAAVALLVFKTTAPQQGKVDLDAVLRDRQSYGSFREFIAGGREVWIYGPSAVNALTHSSELEREVLKRGGRLRVLLQNPDALHGMEVLRRQLDQMGKPLLDQDIRRSLTVLSSIAAPYPQQVDYRVLDDSPGFSLIVVDPDGRDGRLIVEYFGYNNHAIVDRMHIQITRDESQHWFEYWARQFEMMWDDAKAPGA